jgi:hypothetical protein
MITEYFSQVFQLITLIWNETDLQKDFKFLWPNQIKEFEYQVVSMTITKLWKVV